MSDEYYRRDRHIGPSLKYYKLHPDVENPAFATEGSACFDLRAFIPEGTEIRMYDSWGSFNTITVDEHERIFLPKGTRALIPIGLIFDIGSGWSIRLHARSGMALRSGLVLTNSEGIIDSDYVSPVLVMMTNVGNKDQAIINGNRICQAEMVQTYSYVFEEIKEKPLKKANRTGGFGSTGTK